LDTVATCRAGDVQHASGRVGELPQLFDLECRSHFIEDASAFTKLWNKRQVQ